MTNLVNTWTGHISLFLFFVAYILIIFEEKIHLRKSKPIVLVSCLMWLLIGVYEAMHGGGHAHEFIEHLIAEIAGLFFFLLVAMTYINTLASLNVFQALRARLLSKRIGFLMFIAYYMQRWEDRFMKKLGLKKDRREVSRLDIFKKVE
ncbi:MAG: hypothetical protein ACE5KZ_15750 [Candidatus Scalinduaceae bacterium]